MPPATLPQAFELALQHHQAGRLAEAEALYRQVLAAQPDHADALHHLGIVALQAGRGAAAIELIGRSVAVNPNHPGALSNLGEAYRGAGRFDEAAASYRRSLALRASPDTESNLGNALKSQGRLDEAIAAYRRALQLQPNHATAHFNLGIALAEQGRHEEAVEAYRRALEIKPDHPETHNSLANALRKSGHGDEALAAYRHALRLNPNYPEALNNLGITLAEKGEWDEAISAYQRVIQIQPGRAEAYNNLGNAQREKGQIGEAVATYHRALQLKPAYPDAYYNLGIALADQGRLDEAVSAYRRALEINPDHPGVYNNLGHTLKDQGLIDEAVEAFRHAVRLKPEQAWLHSNLVYTLHFQSAPEEGTIEEEHRRWNQQFETPWKKWVETYTNAHDAQRRLRIGYVSPDFLDQVVGRNLAPLFRHHDHEHFEIFCYSGVKRPDPLTEEFRRRADHWRSTVGVADDALAEMIRRDAVDILVDLTQHMAENRLPVLAHRPAPVQVSFAGYPATTGLEEIQYRISDRFLEGESADRESGRMEQVPLIDSFWCYDPCGLEVEVNALPAQKNRCVTFGCLNNFCKVNEPALKLWARVLGKIKDSRLVLLSPPGSARQRVREIFEREGIEAHRVEFVGIFPRESYLEQCHRLDIALDPFPYNGHTTSLDALWMGVPVVSLVGSQAVARAGWSQMANLGLEEWVAFSEDDYIRIAMQLAGDPPRLSELRATLRPRMEASPLMDARRFAQNIETAYRTMWRRWCAENPSGAR